MYYYITAYIKEYEPFIKRWLFLFLCSTQIEDILYTANIHLNICHITFGEPWYNLFYITIVTKCIGCVPMITFIQFNYSSFETKLMLVCCISPLVLMLHPHIFRIIKALSPPCLFIISLGVATRAKCVVDCLKSKQKIVLRMFISVWMFY